MPDYEAIAEAVINGKNDVSEQLTQQALDEGASAKDILQKGLIAGMDVVGTKFKANEFYIPEVLIAARAMKAGVALLQPLLAELADSSDTIKVVAGTVMGDLHDIGKNLVVMMLEGAGFHVIDAGVDCSPETFVEAIKENSAHIVCLSALLTTTLPSMKDTIEALSEAGIRDEVKVLIGGAPVTQEYADEIGADGYAPDAASGVDKVKELMGAAAA
ncbi:MAG: corrinoid protein [Planctomycetota bacterium]|jgi:5-methyltetrahydrofolate--homocysteine methyltransferase|nr:corrinoid protein [Planctomycetota bacterium]MDP7252476.1 corrinoid protein [Planctomycetota bacterium]